MQPPSIDVANDFYHDSNDLLERYKLTIEHFYSRRSARLKLFVDLRMATECILKALAVYHTMDDLERNQVISKVESYRHKIEKVAKDAAPFVAEEKWKALEPYISELSNLPIGLRYRLDVFDFRDEKEELYYATVGDDDWLDRLHDAVRAIVSDFNDVLGQHARILSGEELWEELIKPRHNKYAKK